MKALRIVDEIISSHILRTQLTSDSRSRFNLRLGFTSRFKTIEMLFLNLAAETSSQIKSRLQI